MADAEWQWRCGSARADLNVMDIGEWKKVQQNFVTANPNS